MSSSWSVVNFFFFNDTATTEIYTLSLHDALPISRLEPEHRLIRPVRFATRRVENPQRRVADNVPAARDRKSTRLNSSHLVISYAVFCLEKKKLKHPSLLAYGVTTLLY